ncbi:hypothetical protein ACGH2B_03610 [Streptomyces sp. BBFR2]|uniref:hypothetical protein n=1 Tax=Streptomyces sp. BBFR2 TaxID=3372854 RepID=UPI0037D99C4E
MAEEIKTAEDLKRLFGNYHGIADLVDKVSHEIDHINQLNLTAGGQNDDTAKAYKKVAGVGTQVLTDLAKTLRDMTASTGEGGQDAMKIFDAAKADAEHFATSWDKMVDEAKKAQKGEHKGDHKG